MMINEEHDFEYQDDDLGTQSTKKSRKRKFETLRKYAEKNKSNFQTNTSAPTLLNFTFYDPSLYHVFSPYLDNFTSYLVNYNIGKRNENQLAVVTNNNNLFKYGKNYIYDAKDLRVKNQRNIIKIPDHVVNDFFNLYFNKPSDLVFDNSKSSYKIKLIKYLNNSQIKILTNNHYINSYYFTEASILILSNIIKTLNNIVGIPGQPQDSKNPVNNPTDVNYKTAKELQAKQNNVNFLNSYNNNRSFKSLVDHAPNNILTENHDEKDMNNISQSDKDMLKDYEETLKKFLDKLDPFKDSDSDQSQDRKSDSDGPKNKSSKGDNSLNKVIQNSIEDLMVFAQKQSSDMSEFEKNLGSFGSGSGKDIGELSEISSYEKIIEQLRKIRISDKDIDSFLNKIIKNAFAHFRFNDKFVNEHIVDSNVIESINELELMIDDFSLFDINLNDITTKRRLKDGKFSLYIDISGSMSSSDIPLGKGENLSRIVLAKALGLKLYNMGIVDNIYLFDTNIHVANGSKNHLKYLFSSSANGGTSFKAVYDNISKQRLKNPKEKFALVLTDGEDSLNYTDYNQHIYWVGIGNNAKFSCFKKRQANDENLLPRYISNNQCINFSADNSGNFVMNKITLDN